MGGRASTCTPSSSASDWRTSSPSGSSSAGAPRTSRWPRPARATERTHLRGRGRPLRPLRPRRCAGTRCRQPVRERQGRPADGRSRSARSSHRTTSRCTSTATTAAPDLLLTPDDLPLDDIRGARVFWATVTGLSQEPSRGTHFAAWEARGRRGAHHPRPRLPADVLGRDPADARRAGGQEPSSTSPSPSATARSARSPSARPTPTGPPTPCSTAAWTSPSSSRVPRGCWPRRAGRACRGGALPRPRRQRSRCRRRVRRQRSCHGLLDGWAARADAAVRQRRRRHRRLAARVLDGDADTPHEVAALLAEPHRRGGRQCLTRARRAICADRSPRYARATAPPSTRTWADAAIRARRCAATAGLHDRRRRPPRRAAPSASATGPPR